MPYDSTPAIRNQSANRFTSHSYHAAVQSMLLGLHFRNWLSSGEVDLLKLIVPSPASLRLQLGEHIIRGQRSVEFAIAPTDHPFANQGDALFTQVWRPDQNDNTGSGLIHSATIGRINNQDLILSVFEPSLISPRSDLSDQIGATVARFRQALVSAAEVATTLKAKLPADDDYLVVNRASGRVIISSETAANALELAVETLVDCEYSTLSQSLSHLALKRGLHLENLSVAEMHLATVTFLSSRSQLARPERDNFFGEFFVHAMRNKLGVITAASSHLETIAQEEESADAQELAEIIQSQAVELDRQIERLRLFVDYAQLPCEPTRIDKEIYTAIAQIEASSEADTVVDYEPTASGTEIALPQGALATLVEATLQSHLASPGRSASIGVTTSDNPTAIIICLTTRFAPSSQPAKFSERWQRFATRMAAKMGCSIESSLPDNHSLTTTIAISKERK